MAIKSYSTTAASNNSASPNGAPEGMAPSGVNDTIRQIMADIRSDYDGREWRDWGHTVTYASATTFTVATDVTAIYTANRPIKCTDATTLYGYVASSSYGAPNTTVTVTLDSGNLSASLTAVALGVEPTTQSVPIQAVRNGSTAFLASPNVFTADQTIRSTDAGAAAAPNITLDRNSASPAASDVLGAIPFSGRNASAATKTYAQVQGEIVDTTAASEDGKLAFQTMVAGTLGTAGYVAQGLVLGSPTGGDKGAGTLNVSSNIYINGANAFGWVLVGTGSASAAATADITSGINSTYSRYRIVLTRVVPATNNVNLLLRTSQDTGSTFASGVSYEWTVAGTDARTGVLDSVSAAATSINLTGSVANACGMNNLSTQNGQFTLEIENPSTAGIYKFIRWEGKWHNNNAGGSTIAQVVGSGYYSANSNAIDAIRILASSGNITLNWALYGMV